MSGPANDYNELRTHRSLDKDAPVHRPIEGLGAIISRPVLGGLHHQYCRIRFSVHTECGRSPGCSTPTLIMFRLLLITGSRFECPFFNPLHWSSIG